ncbi:hypothetical protein SELMODRAFT_422213 [Selaginella moellendorffii]|uniref:Uncharacterized protein n=1 Tax=Selaginella moellendorffii TaxID=88036 RepID=D8SHR1_SELML|nr:hypothetical protein SELMODRAFT_422213 [Selaginella moellendorffii]
MPTSSFLSRKKDARLPRPCPVILDSGFVTDDESECCVGGAASHSPPQPQTSTSFQVEVRPGLLPAPIRPDDSLGPDDPVIAPYADFVHFTQCPEVPRKLAGRDEIRSQSWPLPAPEEMSSKTQQVSLKSSSIPAVFFAKRHRFTIFNYGDLLETSGDCNSCTVAVAAGDREDEEIARFTELSSKVDYCIRVKNSYQFSNEIGTDPEGVFRDCKPRICAVCSVKTKASLLPDLRHKYRFTFFHTIHVYSPTGAEVESKVVLDEKSKIEPVSIMKICPTGRKMEKLKPEIVTLLQVTHFVRVETSVNTDISPSMMPRPLAPEFREPKLIIIDEDVHGKAPPGPPPEPEPETEPKAVQPPERPSRSEPAGDQEEEHAAE